MKKIKKEAWNKGISLKEFKKSNFPIKNLINVKFNKWTVISFAEFKTNYNSGREAYWNCKCECGIIKAIRQSYLICNRSKSCRKCRNYVIGDRILADNMAAKRSIFDQYKRSAKKRNIEFDLSFEEFCTIISQNCNYCLLSPSNIKISRWRADDYYYNGIDRVDNNIGYALNNCVPCCEKCNWMKREFSKNEFLDHVGKIYQNSIHCG